MSVALSQTFDFNSQPVRVAGTAEQPLFVATDVCRVLEIQNASQALESFDEDEKGLSSADTLGGAQELLCVTEPGLYRLIFKSRKPQAKVFQRWVCHEVLPQIRQQGFYMNTALDFVKYPVAGKFAELFNWLRSLEVGADVAADVARSLTIRDTPMARKAATRSLHEGKYQIKYTVADLLTVMGSQGWRFSELQMECLERLGMSRATYARLILLAKAEGSIGQRDKVLFRVSQPEEAA